MAENIFLSFSKTCILYMEDINYRFLDGWPPIPHAVVVLNEVIPVSLSYDCIVGFMFRYIFYNDFCC